MEERENEITQVSELSHQLQQREIRSVNDPSRKGRIVRGPRNRSDGQVFLIKWYDGAQSWTVDYEFEYIDDTNEDDVFKLLEERRYGRLNDLRRNLTFFQLSGQLANIVYSMNATNTDFYPYQYKPLLTFLDKPSKGLLIADDVGLGKTIEAGLIWTELRARFDARRLLVVCPAMLREKWALELQNRFGIDPRILNADELNRTLQSNKEDTEDGQALICSIQGLRPPKDWDNTHINKTSAVLARTLESLREEPEPTIDLLIIDEAHYLRNPGTRSAELGTLLREISEHVVLLSATPINNHADDLYHLLHLLDPDTFSDSKQFPEVIRANEPLVQARNLALDLNVSGNEIRDKLEIAQSHPLLNNSQQLRTLLESDLEASELNVNSNRVKLANRIERVNLLRHTINRTRKYEVHEWKVLREARMQFVHLDIDGPERKFYTSVTEAIRSYARYYDISDGFLLSTPQRQMSSCMYAAARSWRERSLNSRGDDLISQIYEDFGLIEFKTRSVGPLIKYIANIVLPDVDVETLKNRDTKYDYFRDIVSVYTNEYPKSKVIVFSYFKATLDYLQERLRESDIQNYVLHGGIDINKQVAIDRFRESKSVNVMLASEVASEGVDLQFCSLLINYDLPWNPMKIEQRIGRIDRLGQQQDKVLIWNMGYYDTVDERIYTRLLDKLGVFERALGSIDDILGKEIGALTRDLMSRDLTPEQEEERIEQTSIAIEFVRHQEDELEKSASHLIAHGGDILQRVQAAHDFGGQISDVDLKVYVKDYLYRYARGFEFKEEYEDPLVVNVRLSTHLANRLSDYVREKRLHRKTKLGSGDAIRCRFRNKVENIRGNLETVNQFHPLIRFISAELKGERDRIYPLVAVSVEKSRVPRLRNGFYVFVCKKWSFTGLKTIEKIQTRALRLGTSPELLSSDLSWDLVNHAKRFGDDWLAVDRYTEVESVSFGFDYCDEILQEDYNSERQAQADENYDRIRFQMETAKRHRDRQLAKLIKLVERFELEGSRGPLQMTKGRIGKIERKFDMQLSRFGDGTDMKSRVDSVCYGVLVIQ